MQDNKFFQLTFDNHHQLGLEKKIPLKTVQSVEIRKDNKGVYVSGQGSLSFFGYVPSCCIYLFDITKNQLIGTFCLFLHWKVFFLGYKNLRQL